MGAWLGYDFEWPRNFSANFAGRTSSLDMLGAKIDFVTYFERGEPDSDTCLLGSCSKTMPE